MSIAEQIKSLRTKHNLTQNELAKKIGVTRQAYANYEQGTREPSMDIIKKLCVLFDCTSDELLEIDTPSDRNKVHINNSFNHSKNIKVNIKK